jgi:GTP-binding protein Era
MNCEKLLELLIANLPEGPALYPEDFISEESEHDIYSELIREAALELLNEELPHSLMVTIEEITLGEDGKTPVIYGKIFLERDSQKKILLGKSHVGVESEWQRNPRALEKFGF